MRKTLVTLAIFFGLIATQTYAQRINPPPIGIPGGPDLPQTPYELDFLVGRSATFNVNRGSGALAAKGSYVIKFTTNSLITVKGVVQTKDLSPRPWDFQLFYFNLPRAGDYTFKMTAPLSGTFSNVLFATTNAPPVVAGTQYGTFYMTEKRVDMSLDTNPDIVWQMDDGHLGVWFMKNAINGTILDTNLNKGFYFDSLYLATGHQFYDPNWRIACQSDLDLNGMQDWIWQNTNSGLLRAWLLTKTNFVDPSVTNYNYHVYSQPLVSSGINPNDYTITTNLTPTSITNYFTQTTTTTTTNFLSGPGLEITTILDGTFYNRTNILLPLYTTNFTTFTVTNITTLTNQTGSTVYLTNVATSTNYDITANNYQNFTLTNVSSVEVSGRSQSVTNVLNIPDLQSFTGAVFQTDNVGNSGHSVTTMFVYTNYPGVVEYFTSSFTTTYADIVPGYFLVTYTTNYTAIATTNVFNPFIREVTLEAQSPFDASSRLVAMADLDNDGFPDYIFRNTNGMVFYESYFENFADAFNNPNRILAPASTINQAWNVAGIVDLNNDGWPDILWQNIKNGATSIWYMKGKSDPDAGFLYQRLPKNGLGSLNGGAAMPNWRIAGNADFNHDGQMDILLRNTNTGQLIFWYLNGPRLMKSSTIGGPVMPWQIVGPK